MGEIKITIIKNLSNNSVLIFNRVFLPGFKAGGPIRTIVNITEQLNQDFDFYVFTSDRDDSDVDPYPNIHLKVWNKQSNVKIYYNDTNSITIFSLFAFFKKNHFSLYYFNSFFSFKYSILPIIVLKIFFSKQKILLAPRGEFSSEALNIKRFKKRLFILFSKLFRLHTNIIWQASSEYEKKDIAKVFVSHHSRIKVSPDLSSIHEPNTLLNYGPKINEDCLVKIIFLSRITKMKNLEFLISVLSKLSENIIFDIYGPIDDKLYWEKCKSLMNSSFKSNIKYSYKGVVHPGEVINIFGQYDLFVLPTKGENFGHVILESLSAGTPVLLSDKTQWSSIPTEGLTCNSISSEEKWVLEIEKYINFTSDEKKKIRFKAKNLASKLICNSDLLNQQRKLFLDAIHGI